MDKLPIPTCIWTRLLAFLRAGCTGTVTLRVHSGTVTHAVFAEHVRPTDA